MLYTVTTTSINSTTSLALLNFHAKDEQPSEEEAPVAAGSLLNPGGDHIVFLDPDGGISQTLLNHLKGKQIPKEISVVSPIYGNTYDRVLHLQKDSVCAQGSIRTSPSNSSSTSLGACLAASGPYCTGDARIEMIFTQGKTLPMITSEEDFRAECTQLREKGVHRIYLSQKAAETWTSGICGPEYSPGSISSYGPLLSNPPIPIVIFSTPHQVPGGKNTFPVSLARRLFGRPHASSDLSNRKQHFGIRVLNGTVQSIVGSVNGSFRLTSENNACTTVDPSKKDQYVLLAVHHEEDVEELSIEVSGCVSPSQEEWTNVDSSFEMQFPGIPLGQNIQVPLEHGIRHMMHARTVLNDTSDLGKLPLMERAEKLAKMEDELSEARTFLRVWQQALFTEEIHHPLLKLFHRVVQDLSIVLETGHHGGGADMLLPNPSMRQISAPVMSMY